MSFDYEQPPDKLCWYYLPSLLSAEAGTLSYNRERYPVHGVSNNTVACIWCGLLADSHDGPVLTDLGRSMLADWKASPSGQRWLAEENATADQDDGAEPSGPAAPKPAPERAAHITEQPDDEEQP